MPAPGPQTTLDGNPKNNPPTTAPYRPGDADFNGIGLEDSQRFPPNPRTMPTADLLNCWSAFAVMFGRLCQMATLSVRYSGGSPVYDGHTAAPSAVVQGTFTIARTGGGAASGDISITWPAGTFPASLTRPKAFANGTTPVIVCVSEITNGIRVVTQTNAGAIVDAPFTCEWM